MVGLLITLILGSIALGSVMAMYWDEIVDWVYEQIEKSPHQIKRKWKTKSFGSLVYHWECDCGKQEWSTSKTVAYSHFVSHRKRERKEAKMNKEVTETEGW